MIQTSMIVPSERVVRLVASGRKIEAIRLLREEEGLGLEEAKEVVDGLAVDAPQRSLPKAGREDRGLVRLVVVIAVVGAVVAALLLG